MTDEILDTLVVIQGGYQSDEEFEFNKTYVFNKYSKIELIHAILKNKKIKVSISSLKKYSKYSRRRLISIFKT